MNKLTTEEFTKRAKEIHGDKYDYSLVEYRNKRTKVKIICKKHGVFEQSPHNHIHYSQNCPQCAKSKYKKMRMSQYNFIKKAEKIHGDKYDYSLIEYINSRTKVKIICLKHGTFEQSPESHLKGSGCKKCGLNQINTEVFIRKAEKAHGNKYDYSLANCEHSREKVKIICPKHGVFEQIAQVHIQGSGCRKCGLNQLSNQDFIEKARKIHKNKYKYNMLEYLDWQTPVSVECKKHSVFEQRPGVHLGGSGCPLCNESKGEKLVEQYLIKKGVKYIREYRFKNCKYKNALPFDFYLPQENVCIEFDGVQHQKPLDFFGGKDAFIELKKRDRIKNKYCKDNNINLIRIGYDDNIEEKLYAL